jgi:hypothetical protein
MMSREIKMQSSIGVEVGAKSRLVLGRSFGLARSLTYITEFESVDSKVHLYFPLLYYNRTS